MISPTFAIACPLASTTSPTSILQQNVKETIHIKSQKPNPYFQHASPTISRPSSRSSLRPEPRPLQPYKPATDPACLARRRSPGRRPGARCRRRWHARKHCQHSRVSFSASSPSCTHVTSTEPELTFVFPSGVAIGSSIGHAVSGFFGGGAANEPLPAEAAAQNNVQANGGSNANNQAWGNNCAGATQQFTRCMDEQGGNMQICGWYLEQLKACQAAASQY